MLLPMMGAYSAAPWTGFAAATAGCAATLAGLVFIAVSINLARILAYPNLPGRAAQTLIMFTIPLVLMLFVLVPAQGSAALGWELAGTGVVIGAGLLVIDKRAGRAREETRRTWLLSRIFPAVASSGCAVAAGAALLSGGGGLLWLVPAVLIALLAGLLNAWVLLVEILR
jgi:hypothetical protein